MALPTQIHISQSMMEDDTDILFMFVTENKDKLSRELQIAYETVQHHCPRKKSIQIITQDEVLELRREQLAPERYMFIFDKFEGAAFIHIENMKDKYALGVKCVLSVLNEELSILADYFHFYSLCMKDLFLSFSSVTDPKRKAWLSKVVHYMGGMHGQSFSSCTTHLVTDDVFSKKIPFAIEYNVKIMRVDWIDEIWKQHQNFDFKLRADDEYFDKFQLPIFSGLIFTTTGIEVEEKRELMKMIEDNGGIFSQVFKSSTVKILITTQKEVNSPKYKAAMKYDIHCLSAEWVRDSIAAGYAIPRTENYVICAKINAISTPEKVAPMQNLLPFDNTMLSDITTTDFTQKSIILDATSASRKSTRNNAESSSRSMRSKTLVDEKKNDTFKKPALPGNTRDTLEVPPPPRVSVYNRSPAPSTIEFNEDEDESIIPILTGKRVFAYGFKEDHEFTQITNECEKYGAHVVESTFSKQVDYIITPSAPIDRDYPEPKMKHLYIVNDFWLEESIEEGRCLEPKFYHYPIFESQITKQVLKNEMFVLTNYKMDRERPFLKMIIKCLGGDSKEHLNKNDDVILISPSQEGRKYSGAKLWNFAVLRAEWLYACYKHQTRYDETEFLVGDVPPSKRNKTGEHSSMIPFSQETDADEDMHEEEEYMINRRGIETATSSALPKRVAQLRGPVIDSPKTPTAMDCDDDGGEALSISKLCEDMPTPQRELTKAVLRESDDKNQPSPRAQRQKELLQTPGMTQKFNFEESSPMPPTPDCMRKPPVDHSIRPDSSPDSQWYWNQKFESLDRMYEDRSSSSKKTLLDNLVTPPYQNTRHDFFKKRIPQYRSPDPRDPWNNHHTAGMSQEAANFFDDSERIEMQKIQDRYDMYEKENMEKRYSMEERRKIGYVDDYVPPPKNEIIWVSEAYRKKEDEEIEASRNKSILASISINQSRHIVSHHHRDEQKADSSDSEEEEEPESSNSEHEWLFAVSSGGLDTQEKAKIIDAIYELNGKIVDEGFNYLVMPKLNKSSKYFSALARGVFVLHSDFVFLSKKEGHFLDPENFEIGNSKCKINMKSFKASADEELFRSPYICRQAVIRNPEKYQNGLFTNMNFILFASTEKRKIYKDVIEIGGGNVESATLEIKPSILKRKKIDYCLFESQTYLSVKDREIIASCNITVRSVRFIYEHLLSENK